MLKDNFYILILVVYGIIISIKIYDLKTKISKENFKLKLPVIQFNVNLTIFIISIPLLILSILFHLNIFNYSSPIEHVNSNFITLQDFKGFNIPGQTLDGASEFAFISTSIEWNKNGNELELKSFFHPSRSYVFNEKLVNHFLLSHELYHFHIKEYYARLIRRELSQFDQMPSDEIIENVVEQYEEMENQMQMEYDETTYHSYVLKEQKLWQRKIDSLLSLQKEFTKTKIIYK